MTAEIEERSGKMLVCSHCPKEFRYNSERIRHEMSHSPGFQCDVCSKTFSFISALRRHKKQHQRTGSVKCEECNRKFRDEVLLKRHIKYAHKGTFACTKCQVTFNSDQALRTHMKTHKPESERRFKCSFEGCIKSFNFSHHLKHHELTHTNDKQHFCAVCGKGFIQSHHLKTHLKTHDPSEWLCCQIPGCSKRFSTEYARKRHMATHKMKPDSGISSDSNSSEAFTSKEYDKDANGEEHIPQDENTQNSGKCDEKLQSPTPTNLTCPTNALTDDFEQVLSLDSWKTNDDIKPDNIFDDNFEAETWIQNKLVKEVISRPIFDKDIGDCSTAPGGCIMGPEHCVCVDLSKPKENYVIPIEDIPIGNVAIENSPIEKGAMDLIVKDAIENSGIENGVIENSLKENRVIVNNEDNLNSNSQLVLKSKTYNKKQANCGGCDCARSCSKKTNLNNEPNIEYRKDGVIKLIDTFDIDMPMLKAQSQNVPFRCKDVIGNCLVGGEECLCAKMMMDDQQAMAQEIDDITPKPENNLI